MSLYARRQTKLSHEHQSVGKEAAIVSGQTYRQLLCVNQRLLLRVLPYSWVVPDYCVRKSEPGSINLYLEQVHSDS